MTRMQSVLALAFAVSSLVAAPVAQGGSRPLLTTDFSEEFGQADIQTPAAAGSILRLAVEDKATGQEVTELKRGRLYNFVIYHDPAICTPYENTVTIYRGQKRVYRECWENLRRGRCGLTRTSVTIDADERAPLGEYTWGAKSENSTGTSTYYPASFTIVP